jgi:hypothetical protein
MNGSKGHRDSEDKWLEISIMKKKNDMNTSSIKVPSELKVYEGGDQFLCYLCQEGFQETVVFNIKRNACAGCWVWYMETGGQVCWLLTECVDETSIAVILV